MRLGIIPARAGSKGVPGKNILPLAGRPLLAWTIEAARASGLFDRLVVSTDGPEIAAVARAEGADVVDRPSEFAGDEAPAKAAIRHAVECVAAEGSSVDLVAYLQPTSPLRAAADIAATMALVEEAGFDSAASFTVAIPHPDRAFLVAADGRADPVQGHDIVWRGRQERAPQYHLNGAVYVLQPALALADPTPRILHGRLGAHVMPAERSIDIDTLFDFALCEALMANGTRSLL